MSQRFLKLAGNLVTESGRELVNPTLSYRVYGDLKDSRRPVVWVCHALTANDDPFDWWPGLFGENDFFNPHDYTIICANMLGSCYGSTGPLSLNLANGKTFYHRFPLITVRDNAKAFAQLAKTLGVEKIDLLIGASLGGQVALQWAVDDSHLFESAVFIATNAQHSPWGIAFNESQRMAIENDPTWGEPNAKSGLVGMKTARSLALLSYRNYTCYSTDQPRSREDELFDSSARSYQRYQGEKLANRFNAISYHRLSHTMDSHDISAGYGSINRALKRLKMPVLSISMQGDILFPEKEQVQIADGVESGIHKRIETKKGHDGFLIETAQLSAVLKDFVNKPVFNQITL
jgi:homoserine O-acetyltransferase